MVRALVVDDSRIMRMVIRGHLRQCGLNEADIREAGNGQEALDAIGEQPVDLVVSDINMPIMDGEQLLTWLAEEGFLDGGEAVMVTSRYERHLFRRLLHTGASTIIRKPFSIEGFLRQLEPVLQQIADRKGEAWRAPVAAMAPPGFGTPTQAPVAPVPEDEITLVAGAPDREKVLVNATRHALRTAGLDTREVEVEAIEDGVLLVAEVETALGHVVLYGDREACNQVGLHLTRLPPTDDDLRADTLGELGNIVVGVWQSRLGQETPFSTPRSSIVEADDVVWEGLHGLALDDGGRVFLGLLT